MGDLKLFKIEKKDVMEIQGDSVQLEKSLQTLIERNLESLLGVRFLGTEYSTGKKHGGRIDTIGIDENGCPVIIEYKRSVNENVINQGLYYLDWLLDHKGEFELLVMKAFGKEISENIEWRFPRLLCIAGDFTKYDIYAVDQINRNIELIRYRKFGIDLLLFDLVKVTSGQESVDIGKKKQRTDSRSMEETIGSLKEELRDRYENLRSFILTLGDDVQTKFLKYYEAFKKIKNFVCLEVHPQNKTILLYIKVNPSSIKLEEGFTRDVRKIGHFGTGDLEIRITSKDDIEKAKNLIAKSYENS
ncbi:MAG: DUF5655 domain-containing protein [Promethearchaeota archaeon]